LGSVYRHRWPFHVSLTAEDTQLPEPHIALDPTARHRCPDGHDIALGRGPLMLVGVTNQDWPFQRALTWLPFAS
jgi:hypothetical protein